MQPLLLTSEGALPTETAVNRDQGEWDLQRLRFRGGHQACSCQTSEPSYWLTLSSTLLLQFKPHQRNINIFNMQLCLMCMVAFYYDVSFFFFFVCAFWVVSTMCWHYIALRYVLLLRWVTFTSPKAWHGRNMLVWLDESNISLNKKKKSV